MAFQSILDHGNAPFGVEIRSIAILVATSSEPPLESEGHMPVGVGLEQAQGKDDQ